MTLDAAVAARLAPWGFDAALLERFIARCARAEASNAVQGALGLPAPADIAPVLPSDTDPGRRALQLGRDAIARGQVGALILAGGMATRFGGVVKAVVPVLEGKTFLQLKLEDVRRVGGDAVPVFIMSSFATHDRLRAHVAELGAVNVHVFSQDVSLRLTPEGALFREADGDVSPYATGHGDLPSALRRSGLLSSFRAKGGTTLFMSNVDNLGATLDPLIIGTHLARGAKLTAEVVRKVKGDKGGAPARLDGRVQIIEGFRFPSGFDQDAIPVFNTNTFALDAAALDAEFALPYYRVEKKVDGQTAVQFERLVGELTAFLPSTFVEVPREGGTSRFLPVKDPDELTQRLSEIRLVLARR